MSATSSQTSSTNVGALFFPITKSSSVPDIHQKVEDSNGHAATNNSNRTNTSKNESNKHNLLATNSGSIESAIASPTGSLEQFEVNSTLPLTPDDAADLIADNKESQSSNNANIHSTSTLNNKLYDSNSFRFRRHSSQSSINSNPTNLILLNSSASTNGLNASERICSSPINNLKMSSRVCQIKIDEGIEPHLSREIKSEREMQSTLKLKSSCDDLMLNGDELAIEEFDNKDNNRLSNNSPNTVIPSAITFRHNSQSNMPSPSISSCYSYSNSCSPTGGVSSHNPGYLRCFSPSTSTNTNQISQNYFSQSPSPTRKLFVSRRSMSPIPCQLRPNSFSAINTSSLGSKRKFIELDSNDSNQLTSCSPKRSNTENQQEFVQPLQIYTGNSKSLNAVRSTQSSPFSPLATIPSSPNANSISSLIITAPNSDSKMLTNCDDEKNNNATVVDKTATNSSNPVSPSTREKAPTDTSSSNFVWPSISTKQIEENSNKYTFKPIQLPPPLSTNNNLQLNSSNRIVQTTQQQRKRQNNTFNSASTIFTSLAQSNGSILQNYPNNNSPLNSPANYLYDSPISYSPSVSTGSSSIAGEKPDSGYQSSIQNNSDSESCI